MSPAAADSRRLRVVLLGKRRYAARPGTAAFLASGDDRGHHVDLVNRDDFLRLNLDTVDVVLAKSHYHDPAVRRHIERAEARVINTLESTALCRSRLGVMKTLATSNVAIPPFVGSIASAAAVPLPWIAKPNLGGDHRLEHVRRVPEYLDVHAKFYQSQVPTTEVSKVYSIGDQQHLVHLSYESVNQLSNPLRQYAGPASDQLRQAAEAVGDALGLAVFNTDFIEHDGQFLAIDVNPFPSLESIPDGHLALWALLEQP